MQLQLILDCAIIPGYSEEIFGNFQLKRERTQMKPEIQSAVKPAIWGAVGGAAAAIIIGFVWGGWTTSSTTQERTDEALLATRAAICVAQFMKEPHHQEKLAELKAINSWERYKTIEAGGWDKMPGEQDAHHDVKRACIVGLEVLMDK